MFGGREVFWHQFIHESVHIMNLEGFTVVEPFDYGNIVFSCSQSRHRLCFHLLLLLLLLLLP